MASGTLLIACVLLALNYTFIEPHLVQSMFCITLVFTFCFAVRNPDFLLVKNLEELDEQYDLLRDKNLILGLTPWYPATLLVAILYISFVEHGWPSF